MLFSFPPEIIYARSTFDLCQEENLFQVTPKQSSKISLQHTVERRLEVLLQFSDNNFRLNLAIMQSQSSKLCHLPWTA